MVDKKRIHGVLKRVFAAKQEQDTQDPTAPVNPETPAPQAPQVAANRKRYYFFDAQPENAISFTALKDILQGQSAEKQALIQKLQGGNSGPYMADYFQWKKVVVATNQYSQDGKSYVVYECDLSPFGSKIVGTEKVTPQDAGTTAEQIEKDFLLFEDKRGNSNIINPDKSGESVYIDAEPPGNIARIVLSGAQPAGNLMNYDNFERKYDQYHIWVPNLSQLMLPNMEQPQNDDVPGGHYRGGQKAYNQFVKPFEQEAEKQQQVQKPDQPSLGEQIEQDKSDVFEPVDQQSQEPNKGDYVDKKAAEKDKKKAKGDFSSEPYSGGTNVMQQLVKDQRACMNIRRAARNVVAAYQSVTPATSPTSTNSNKPKIEVTHDPKKNKEKAQALEDYAEKQEQLQAEIKKVQEQTTNTFNKQSSLIPSKTKQSVIRRFMQ
ncbi:MAG: hypothetical protein GF334_00095 [Candidatus Altiarchaeales archaeon]|nr:hypothetical protein [Candidatus Altiarchaeales archaeon]